MLELRTRLRAPLNQFVDCLWYSTGHVRSHRRERLLPTGCIDVVFKLQEGRAIRVFRENGDTSGESFGGAVVSGAYSRHFAIDTTQSSPTLGIHFQPGGAAPFFDVSLRELMDCHVSLEQLWGRQAAVLRERLMEAASVASMFNLLEQALLNRLTDPTSDYLAIVSAAKKWSVPMACRVKAMSDSMGYRTKRFIRLFHDSVGVTPKLFCRIQRFQSVLERIVGHEPAEWVSVALESGYYDQSHLIRDFRAFAGVTPLEYRPVEPGRKNHMVVNR